MPGISNQRITCDGYVNNMVVSSSQNSFHPDDGHGHLMDISRAYTNNITNATTWNAQLHSSISNETDSLTPRSMRLLTPRTNCSTPRRVGEQIPLSSLGHFNHADGTVPCNDKASHCDAKQLMLALGKAQKSASDKKVVIERLEAELSRMSSEYQRTLELIAEVETRETVSRVQLHEQNLEEFARVQVAHQEEMDQARLRAAHAEKSVEDASWIRRCAIEKSTACAAQKVDVTEAELTSVHVTTEEARAEFNREAESLELLQTEYNHQSAELAEKLAFIEEQRLSRAKESQRFQQKGDAEIAAAESLRTEVYERKLVWANEREQLLDEVHQLQALVSSREGRVTGLEMQAQLLVEAAKEATTQQNRDLERAMQGDADAQNAVMQTREETLYALAELRSYEEAVQLAPSGVSIEHAQIPYKSEVHALEEAAAYEHAAASEAIGHLHTQLRMVDEACCSDADLSMKRMREIESVCQLKLAEIEEARRMDVKNFESCLMKQKIAAATELRTLEEAYAQESSEHTSEESASLGNELLGFDAELSEQRKLCDEIQTMNSIVMAEHSALDAKDELIMQLEHKAGVLARELHKVCLAGSAGKSNSQKPVDRPMEDVASAFPLETGSRCSDKVATSCMDAIPRSHSHNSTLTQTDLMDQLVCTADTLCSRDASSCGTLPGSKALLRPSSPPVHRHPKGQGKSFPVSLARSSTPKGRGFVWPVPEVTLDAVQQNQAVDHASHEKRVVRRLFQLRGSIDGGG